MRRFGHGNADDLWRATLEQVPSLLGRLYYVTSLRDENSGRYRHHGLESVHGAEAADAAIRASHLHTFHRWIRLPLSLKKQDLDAYLAALEEPVEQVLATWSHTRNYMACVPASVQGVERDLFVNDLEVLLAAVRNARGVAGPDPDS
jgi:hypothetical protein